MSYADNLPPGVTPSKLEICFQERGEYDNYIGYRQWLESSDRVVADFENYCEIHFWNQLGEKFLSLLHPDTLGRMDKDYPLENLGTEWALFLWKVLDRGKLRTLIEAYVRSKRDEFEEWAAA
jgi:hypothetical protein